MATNWPLGIGIVGTGYAAKVRAETFQADPRSRLRAVVGRTAESAANFIQSVKVQSIEGEVIPLTAWTQLVSREDIDLVVVCHINQGHGEVVHGALSAGKHVVVEYPLALTVAEAEGLLALATQQQRLLHVEHIELLSSWHQAMIANLDRVGIPQYLTYHTLNPQRPAPAKWTYSRQLFGFPLVGALSRLHRLTHLFGPVKTVACQNRLWGSGDSFHTCLCTAQLTFASGLVADVTYGKGEQIWQSGRALTLHGSLGGLLFDGNSGLLIQADTPPQPLDLGGRKGLFAQDTAAVLNHLETGAELYVTPTDSLYALRVAAAAQTAAQNGTIVSL